MLIAVIDDESAVVEFVRVLLEDEGYTVAAWRTEEGAQAFVVETSPAAVLLDVQMEARDSGLRVLRSIRSDLRTRAIPVVLSTGQRRFEPEQAAELRTLDHHFLPKPYTADALIAAVAHAIGTGVLDVPD